LEIKNSRLDYIIDPSNHPVYIPKTKNGYIESSQYPELLRFIPGATIEGKNIGSSEGGKTFWDPEDKVIFDISQ